MTAAEKRAFEAAVRREVRRRSANTKRAVAQAREYLAAAKAAWGELREGERGHVLDELHTALRGIGHMLDDVESGKDGDK